MFVCLLTVGTLAAEELKFNTEDFPPFNYELEGKVAGPARDLIEKICTVMGQQCSYALLPFRRVIENAQNGEVDGIFSVGRTSEREAFLLYSKPIIKTGYGFFVLADDPIVYSAIADLKDYKFATYGPSSLATTLQDVVSPIGSPNVELEVKLATALKKLSARRYGDKAVVYANKDVGMGVIKSENIQGLRYLGDERPIYYYVGFSRRRVTEAFVQGFNSELDKLRTSGELENLFSKYAITPAEESAK
ncbi:MULTISPECIES: substrate-binding periplasmic protein [unclassified Bradyrhizobium]|uniref:substrate-binding periplasmic protein n=1 Tax=unclassified Bradyrhizobium TaxID=2631580 RepID=UPI0028E64255|nr:MULTISPECIES: transporter substrate-binding domain-containing protein [unclassified Bradyrhizobium]